MKKIKIIIILFGLLNYSLFSLDLKEKVKEKRLPTYIIKNQSYISLKSLLEIMKPESWGKIEDRVFIIYNGTEIKFQVDGNEVIVGNKKIVLDYPPKQIEGEIIVPLENFSYFISQITDENTSIPQQQIQLKVDTKVDKNSYIIVIDPGHGGKDSGAIGNYGLKEKDVNLDVSLRLVDFLEKQIIKYPYINVYFTRNKDIFLTLEERVQIAKDINANIFFSVHTNSSNYNKYSANGFETYYPNTKVESEKLPEVINDEGILQDETIEDTALSDILQDLNTTNIIEESRVLAEVVQEKLAERLLTPDRGAKRKDFYVLKYTPMISVLVEIGFICNPNIELNLRDAEVRQVIAESLGKSIIEYLKLRRIIEE